MPRFFSDSNMKMVTAVIFNPPFSRHNLVKHWYNRARDVSYIETRQFNETFRQKAHSRWIVMLDNVARMNHTDSTSAKEIFTSARNAHASNFSRTKMLEQKIVGRAKILFDHPTSSSLSALIKATFSVISTRLKTFTC